MNFEPPMLLVGPPFEGVGEPEPPFLGPVPTGEPPVLTLSPLRTSLVPETTFFSLPCGLFSIAFFLSLNLAVNYS